jgi:hypothetical protein
MTVYVRTQTDCAVPYRHVVRPDRLAGFGGVGPIPYDSGKMRGNLRCPQRYIHRLQRVFCTSALFSIRHCDESRQFCDRKRAEGKRHTQAVLALGCHRINLALSRGGLSDW